MKPQRSEACADVSEFNLTETGKEKVQLNDLLRSLSKNINHATIKTQLKDTVRLKSLEVPLSKPEADKIKRTIAYEKVSGEIGKWDSIVQSHRSAEQIIFPLKKPDVQLETTEEIAKRFQSKNALEEEVSCLLGNSENVLDQAKALTVAEEKALHAMDLQEAKLRIAELQKMRILLSHKEAKARRQNKIKSKSYHRLLKKDRMKKVMKEFEELQRTDPAAAEEKLKEADKLRILERITLKHKGSGKWSKQQKIRAKYNADSRNALQEEKNLARSLSEKVLPSDQPLTAEVNEIDDGEISDEYNEDGDLLNMYLGSSNIDPIEVAKAKRVNREEKAVPRNKKSSTLIIPTKSIVESDHEEEHNPLIDETTERHRTLEDLENVADSPLPEKADTNTKAAPQSDNDKVTEVPNSTKPKGYVSEMDFTAGTVILDSLVPDTVTQGDEGIDDNEDNEEKMDIIQAFADDDVVSEFKEIKESIIKEQAPEGIDTFLPGWGSWGGTDIKPNQKKQQRFYKQPVIRTVRKDLQLTNVIISEENDKDASKHMVSDLPFPYKSIDQFNSMIRQPIGNTWNTQTSFSQLIAPKVVTKMGKIIDPMDADDLVLSKANNEDLLPQPKPSRNNKRKKPYTKLNKANE